MFTHEIKGDIIVVKYVTMVSKIHKGSKFFFEISFMGEEKPMRASFDTKDMAEAERNKLIRKIEGRP